MPATKITDQRPRGKPDPLVISLVRELTQADLARLGEALPTTVPPLQKARAIHHKQAQLLAEGRSNEEVASIVGTTSARISVLRNDPTFRELLALYTDQQQTLEFESQTRIHHTLVDVLELAATELQDRLIDEPTRKALPTSEIRKIAEFAGDRTIAPPRATQQGSPLPPTRIELNFGFKPKDNEIKTIDTAMIDVEST